VPRTGHMRQARRRTLCRHAISRQKRIFPLFGLSRLRPHGHRSSGGPEQPQVPHRNLSPACPSRSMIAVLGAAVLLEVQPYVKELWRGLRATWKRLAGANRNPQLSTPRGRKGSVDGCGPPFISGKTRKLSGYPEKLRPQAAGCWPGDLVREHASAGYRRAVSFRPRHPTPAACQNGSRPG
jgi:hypothetical protein